MDLISNYEKAVNDIIAKFKEKQGLESNDGHWIANEIGEVYDFGDANTFDFHDILLDIKSSTDKGEIFKWRNYTLRIWSINDMAGGILLPELSYRNWIKGGPRLTDEELDTVNNKWHNLVNEIAELGKFENKRETV